MRISGYKVRSGFYDRNGAAQAEWSQFYHPFHGSDRMYTVVPPEKNRSHLPKYVIRETLLYWEAHIPCWYLG